VEPGAPVERGQEILVIESMKVEIPIKAPAAGRLTEFRVAAGAQIQRGALLAIVAG
jgi:biotin carboxyl carrier protein